ncbi:peptidyl-prolyl cis-trans isomerase FKBP7-like isoform X2 [Mytilus edulis]
MIGMCPGEYRKITVPANHAFGNKVIQIPDGRYLKPPVTLIVHATLIQIFRQTQKEIDSAFNIWDTDNDDRLNKQELLNIFKVFIQIVGKNKMGNLDKMLDQWFGMLDVDHNGFITKDEFLKSEHTAADPKSAEMFQSFVKRYMSMLKTTSSTRDKKIKDEL